MQADTSGSRIATMPAAYACRSSMGGSLASIRRAATATLGGATLALLSWPLAGLSASTPPGPPTIPSAASPIELMTSIGSGAPTAQGDFVSAATGLDATYVFRVEVPAATGTLLIELFDADMGFPSNNPFPSPPFPPSLQFFFGTSPWDRNLPTNDNFNNTSSVAYRVRDPSGALVTTLTCLPAPAPAGDPADCRARDNVWSPLWTEVDPDSGHWTIEVDMSSAETAGDDINGYGIAASDPQNGVELNVYAEDFVPPGSITDAGSTTTHAYHPYVMSGCQVRSRDFDFDAAGSVSLTSVTGTAFPGGAISGNDVWNTNAASSFNTPTSRGEYGIWDSAATITNPDNYGTFVVEDEVGPHRLYLPSDSAARPLKPRVGQVVDGVVSGPATPTVGQASRVRLTVWVENLAPYPIAFDAGNVVSVQVPGGKVLYAGSVSLDGAVVIEPAFGSGGEIQWNPGVVAAGQRAALSYDVDVTPTVPLEIIDLTGTVAGMDGTRGSFIDETCAGGGCVGAQLVGATQAFGPLCELSATVGEQLRQASDSCPFAVEVTCPMGGGMDVISGSTTGATADSAPVCDVDSTAPGVWYRVAGNGGNISADLCTAGAYDTRLTVYEGDCTNLTCVGGNEDACGTQSSVTWTSTIGTEYLILVHGNGESGDFTLTLGCDVPVELQGFSVE